MYAWRGDGANTNTISDELLTRQEELAMFYNINVLNHNAFGPFLPTLRLTFSYWARKRYKD